MHGTFNSLLFRQFESELREVIYSNEFNCNNILPKELSTRWWNVFTAIFSIVTDSNLTLVFGGQPGLFYPPILVTNVVSHHKFTD